MGHDHHAMLLATTSPPDHSAHGDHGDHGNHGDHGGDSGGHMMMSMVFHFGCKETILFQSWDIDGVGGLLASMLVIILMGAFYEGLKYYREYLFWKTYSSLQYRAVSLPEKGPVVSATEDNTRVHMVGEIVHKQPPSISSSMHAYQTLLHIIQVTLSFLLMLIFMTYNVWLCLAVVIGAAGGYFLFGWKKSVFVDVTEHCH
jgi:copper transporter 1